MFLSGNEASVDVKRLFLIPRQPITGESIEAEVEEQQTEVFGPGGLGVGVGVGVGGQ